MNEYNLFLWFREEIIASMNSLKFSILCMRMAVTFFGLYLFFACRNLNITEIREKKVKFKLQCNSKRSNSCNTKQRHINLYGSHIAIILPCLINSKQKECLTHIYGRNYNICTVPCKFLLSSQYFHLRVWGMVMRIGIFF